MKKSVAIIAGIMLLLPLNALAATFGETSDGASETCSSTARKKVSSASPSSNGTVDSLTVRFRVNSTGTTTVNGIIYADSGGSPGALLATTASTSVSSTVESAVTMSFVGANQIAVTGGTTYWIGFIADDPGSPSHCISRAASGTDSVTNTDTYADGPSNPFGTPSTEAGPIDAYVTYTAGGSGEEATTTSEVLNREEQLFIYSIIVFAFMFPVWDICFRPLRRMYDNRKGV